MLRRAAVAELADAQDLKSCGGDIVPVRFRSAAATHPMWMGLFYTFIYNVIYVIVENVETNTHICVNYTNKEIALW